MQWLSGMASLTLILSGRCQREERGQEHVGTSGVAQYINAILPGARHDELASERVDEPDRCWYAE